MHPSQKPKLLLVGPSGAGKSTAGNLLGARGWLHVDLDQWQIDGLSQAGLVAEWTAFSHARNPAPLAAEISRRIDDGPHAGAVLTFPSGVVFGIELVRRAVRE